MRSARSSGEAEPSSARSAHQSERGQGLAQGAGQERQALPLADGRPELARQESLLRLMAASPRLQRQCAWGAPSAGGGSCVACEAKTAPQGLQRKALAIGAADDPLEREADQVVERVMGMQGPGKVSIVRSPFQTLQSQPVSASSGRLALQAQDDPAVLRRRLLEVRARLAALRDEREGLDGRFIGSLEAETQRRSLDEATRDLNSDARADTEARTMLGRQLTSSWVRRVVSASRNGSTITLAIPFEIQYLALSDAAARTRSATDIPRLIAAIRDVWQVDIADGEYAGVQFRVVPSIAYLTSNATRAQNAFLIEVRGVDIEPSQGYGHLGLISLAAAHLDGARTIVIAHELLHLFGFIDQYLHRIVTDRRGRQRAQLVVVGAQDAAGRADPLGIIDPTQLSRALAERTITQQDVTRQTTNVRIWQEHASAVLSALGVLPLPPPGPTIDDEEFDPSEELRRIEREGEARLAPIRERRSRDENSLRWLEIAEESMRLEQEERALQARISAASRP
jgi:hypothetical protein